MKYKFVSIKEAEQLIDKSLPVMFDTETIGFYGEIRLAQFYQPHMEEVIMIEYPLKDKIAFLMFIKDLHIVCHSCTYDVDTLQRQLKMPWRPKEFDCTLYLSRITYSNRFVYDLENMITLVLNTNPYADVGISKDEMHKSDWSGELTENQLIYAAIDVWGLQQLYDDVKKSIDNFNYQLDKKSLYDAWLWQNNGFPVDIERTEKKLLEIQAKIKEENLAVNCNSYKQVREFIGSNQSDALGLAKEEYAGNMRAAKVRKVRKLTKQQSFINKWLETEVGGLIYGLFQPSARSGRYTCKEQNLQQLPRALKECFGVTTDSGQVLIFADFAALELRSIAAIVNEVNMVPLLREGADLHNHTTRAIYGDNFTKQDRQNCKMANFLLLYGGGIKMFIDSMLKDADLYLTEQEAGRLKFKWRNLWMSIAKWQDKGAKQWKAGQQKCTPLGRYYASERLPDYLNIEVSGHGADVAKLAMYRLLRELEGKENYVRLANFVHDSYILVCDNDPELYEPIAEILAKVMQEAWFECAQHTLVPDLPMPVDVMVGYNWGDIENGDYIFKHELEGMKYYHD